MHHIQQLLEDCFSDDVHVLGWDVQSSKSAQDPFTAGFGPPVNFWEIQVTCRSATDPRVPIIFDNYDLCGVAYREIRLRHAPILRPSDPGMHDLSSYMECVAEYETTYTIRTKNIDAFIDYLMGATKKKRYSRQFDRDVEDIVGE